MPEITYKPPSGWRSPRLAYPVVVVMLIVLVTPVHLVIAIVLHPFPAGHLEPLGEDHAILLQVLHHVLRQLEDDAPGRAVLEQRVPLAEFAISYVLLGWGWCWCCFFSGWHHDYFQPRRQLSARAAAAWAAGNLKTPSWVAPGIGIQCTYHALVSASPLLQGHQFVHQRRGKARLVKRALEGKGNEQCE